MDQGFLERNHFQKLLDSLVEHQYQIIGPQTRDGAICYAPLDDVDQLPQDIRDEQLPGFYQLKPQNKRGRWFGFANGPQALKPLNFLPEETLWTAQAADSGKLEFRATEPVAGKVAIIGAKACDLAALALQDQHFNAAEFTDPSYQARRSRLFIVAIDCAFPAATCFCHATGDGPDVTQAFDIRLIELDEGFIVAAGSAPGQQLCNTLPLQPLTDAHQSAAERQHQQAVDAQTRKLPETNLHQALAERQDHSHWEDIARRCLACGNCTAVCPSCFCHREQDNMALDGLSSEHVRLWDSCFNQQHSYIHGIVIRADIGSRYRQWLTHKFSSWVDQYGRSGCTGCGRCISWCPSGIDITVELAKLCEGLCAEADE